MRSVMRRVSPAPARPHNRRQIGLRARSRLASHARVPRDGAARLRLEEDATVLFFGGQPLGTRLMQGNFIASSAELLDRALRELS